MSDPFDKIDAMQSTMTGHGQELILHDIVGGRMTPEPEITEELLNLLTELENEGAARQRRIVELEAAFTALAKAVHANEDEYDWRNGVLDAGEHPIVKALAAR